VFTVCKREDGLDCDTENSKCVAVMSYDDDCDEYPCNSKERLECKNVEGDLLCLCKQGYTYDRNICSKMVSLDEACNEKYEICNASKFLTCKKKTKKCVCIDGYKGEGDGCVKNSETQDNATTPSDETKTQDNATTPSDETKSGEEDGSSKCCFISYNIFMIFTSLFFIF